MIADVARTSENARRDPEPVAPDPFVPIYFTTHARQRLLEHCRYGSPTTIDGEIRAAIVLGRYRPDPRERPGMWEVWEPDFEWLYVVNGTRRSLLVVTVIPRERPERCARLRPGLRHAA